MKRVLFFFITCSLVLLQSIAYAQQKDSVIIHKKDSVLYISSVAATADTMVKSTGVKDTLTKKDTTHPKKAAVKRKFDPRRATLYSTFMPGLGQIYNRKYWKLPLVYAAVGIPAYTYFYNKSWYKKTQFALAVLFNGTTDSTGPWRDSLSRVDPKLRFFVLQGRDADLRSYRNEFRKDQDYSILFLLLFWGLNIVDATVDAHLKGFDVSTELSMHVQPSAAPGTIGGIGLAFDLHKTRFRTIALP